MARRTIQPEYLEFLQWCRGRTDALSRKALLIAGNVDRTNRTGHLYRGYMAAVHFLRESPNVQAWLRSLGLSERQPFDHRDLQFARPWSVFMRRHGAKHVILRHILPERYGGLTRTGGGGLPLPGGATIGRGVSRAEESG